MSCEIYLVRHGESQGNLTRNFLGHTDLDLTEMGYKQAECAAKYFENIHIDMVYSSDLQRAFHTAEAVAKTKGLKVIPSKKLREIFAGDWEGVHFLEISEKCGAAAWYDWVNHMSGNTRPKNGESVEELFSRIYAELENIAVNNDGKKILIGIHATPIRVMLHWLENKNLDEVYKTPWVANASVTKLVYENGEFYVEFADDRSHLGDIVTTIPKGV